MIATTATALGLTSDALTGSLAVIVALLLLAVLMLKELMGSVKDSRTWKFNKALGIAIVPLLITFALVVVSKVMDVLR